MNQIEVNISNHITLRQGKLGLDNVPIYENIIEIGTPSKRPVFTLDVGIGPDYIDIKRSDNKDFNVAHYRTRENEAGPLRPHIMLARPVPFVFLRQVEPSLYLMEGPKVDVIDRITAQAFVEKIVEVAYIEQSRGATQNE